MLSPAPLSVTKHDEAEHSMDISGLSDISVGDLLATSVHSSTHMDVSGMSDISLGDLLATSVHSPTPTAINSPVSPPFSPITLTPRGPLQSPISPPFSPLTPTTRGCSSSSHFLPLHDESELVHEDEQPQAMSSPKPQWHGFKIVGDNIDKNVRPRHETLERRGQSLHYFNCYAVLDRVNLSDYSDEPRAGPSTLDIDDILPSEDDYIAILNNFAILAGRVVQEHIPAFKGFPRLVTKHIGHSHQKEMCQQSKVVR